MDEKWADKKVDWKVVHSVVVKDVMKAVWMDVEWDVSMVDCLVVRWADSMVE